MYNFTQRSPITVILLSIVTCGIYFIYWVYVTSKEVNEALGREEINTALVILGCFCFPVMIYVMYKFGNAAQELAGRMGRQAQSSFILWIILAIFFGVGIYIMEYQVQTDLNGLSGPWNYNGGQAGGYGQGYNQQNYNQNQGGANSQQYSQQGYYQPQSGQWQGGQPGNQQYYGQTQSGGQDNSGQNQSSEDSSTDGGENNG